VLAVALVVVAIVVAMITRAAPHPVAAPPGDAKIVTPEHLSQRSVSPVNLDGPPGQALLDRVSVEAGPAVEAVWEFWGTDWGRDNTGPIVVMATGSAAEFAARSGAGGAERPDTAAVAVAGRVDPAARTADDQRIVLAPGAAAMSPDALRIVFRHELFHYAARADTAIDAPRWLTEGVADYVARPAPTAPVRIDTTYLPSDADFTGTPEELSAAYDRAWLFARFVADRYGAPALRLLYLRGAGFAHADAVTALRDVLGSGPDELLAHWREWAR